MVEKIGGVIVCAFPPQPPLHLLQFKIKLATHFLVFMAFGLLLPVTFFFIRELKRGILRTSKH
jgi:hypothetical protein